MCSLDQLYAELCNTKRDTGVLNVEYQLSFTSQDIPGMSQWWRENNKSILQTLKM